VIYPGLDPSLEVIASNLVFDEAERWECIANEVIGGGNQGIGDFIVQYWAWPGGTVIVEGAEVELHTPQMIPASPGLIDAPHCSLETMVSRRSTSLMKRTWTSTMMMRHSDSER
jgi:hypothetical protein